MKKRLMWMKKFQIIMSLVLSKYVHKGVKQNGWNFRTCFFLALIIMATKIPVIGPIIIAIGIIWLAFEFYESYQIVSQEGYDYSY